MKKVIRRVATESTDLTTGDSSLDIKLTIPVELLQGGYIKEIGGAKHFAVLMTILAHSNAEGSSYPTQDKLAALVGMTRQTVSKIVSDLLAVEVDGVPLLSKSKNKSGEFVNNVYTYMSGTQEKEVTEVERMFKNSVEVLKYFQKVYYDVFGVNYIANYKRDASMIKSKLYTNYNDQQLKAIVDTAVTDYEKRWAKAPYLRPTIPMLCGWLGNNALAIHTKEQEKEQQEQQLIERDITAELNVASKYI